MMSITMNRTPETVLLATLHKVGRDVRLVDNFELARIFNEAAKEFGEPFKQFAWHRHYHVSERLSETLQLLDHAGSIVRENAAQTYFRVSPHTAGPFGGSAFDSLDASDQTAVDLVSARIRDAFKGPPDESPSAD
jgi:hypothetical protein